MSSVIKQLKTTVLLLLIVGLLLWLPSNWMLLDMFLTTFATGYAFILGLVVNPIPFSISELMWISFFIFVIVSFVNVIRGLRSHQWVHAWLPFHRMMNVTLSLVTVYTATTGLAYARSDLPIPQWKATVESTEFETILSHFHDDFSWVASSLSFDEKGSVIRPYSHSTLNDFIHLQLATLEDDYFYSTTPSIKPMLFSFLYSEFHITGLYNGLTTEALFNANIPDALLPFTMAHELAHAKGVMREEDANLVAMYVCLTSEDPYLRYSGYFYTFYAMLNLSRYIGDDQAYSRYYQALPLTIRNDYRYQSTFWGQYTLLNDLATFINDVYLRLVGNEGVSSYVDAPQTGTVIENGQPIEVITEFSPFQQLYFWLYYED